MLGVLHLGHNSFLENSSNSSLTSHPTIHGMQSEVLPVIMKLQEGNTVIVVIMVYVWSQFVVLDCVRLFISSLFAFN